jgi:hypothetical protein
MSTPAIRDQKALRGRRETREDQVREALSEGRSPSCFPVPNNPFDGYLDHGHIWVTGK